MLDKKQERLKLYTFRKDMTYFLWARQQKLRFLTKGLKHRHVHHFQIPIRFFDELKS